MLQDYLRFAWDNLTHKKLRSWLTLIGIFIGVTSVVALIGLGEGLKIAITSQFGISSTEVISVQAGGLTGYGPPGSGVVDPLTEEDVDAIERLPSVRRSVPRILEEGRLTFNDRSAFGIATNIPDGDDRKFVYEAIDAEAAQGRMLKDGDNKKVVLGYNFGVNAVGLGKRIKTGDIVEVDNTNFEVVGIMERKGSFIFDNIVLMNDDPLKELMDDPTRVDVIAVQVKNKNLIEEATAEIEKELRQRRDVKIGEEDFEVQTPQAALDQVNQVLTGVQIFVALIASISIIIGAIGIVNTMTTAVLERKSQIGIMKSIGARNSDIFYQFFIEAGLMGVVGGLSGAVIGETIAFVGTLAINAMIGSQAVPKINFMIIIFTLFGTFIIGSVAGIVPAMNAARQHPVDALRG
ncbi:MAG TPA: ABC transporter permease [Candidatus Nanoarchaeia archaeon]|nr:ABC transporter permease [Candidatus Nanoarchaeia archaeon]